jgi:predicted dienelactone hydrolase
LAELERINVSDPILARQLDLTRIGTFGFSFGGGPAAEICRGDERCRATVDLDGGMAGADELMQADLQKPFLGIYRPGGTESSFVFKMATQDAVVFSLRDTVHVNFAGEYLIEEPSPSNREATFTLNAYIVSFFDKYIKGQDDHLLDGPSTNFPRIVDFKKK